MRYRVATEIGEEFERYIAQHLSECGLEPQLTDQNAPYDILLDGDVRLEAKAAYWHNDTDPTRKRGRYQVNIRHHQADWLVVGLHHGEQPTVLVIPMSEIQTRSLTIRVQDPADYTGKYATYKEAWLPLLRSL